MNVFLIAALTTDGFIGRDATHTPLSWTSKEDKKFFSERTKKAGVVVMGASTFKTINRPLPGRLTIVYTKSSQLDIPVNEFKDSLRVTQLSPENLIKNLENEGYSEVAICGGSSIYSLFLKSGLANKLYLTIEPVLFGKGVSLCNDNIDLKLCLVNTTNLSDQTLLLEYNILKEIM